jgi:DNA-binding beta-propeller fold protein YncE
MFREPFALWIFNESKAGKKIMNSTLRLARLLLASGLIATLAGCATGSSRPAPTFLSVQDGRAQLVNGAAAVGSAADTLAVISVVDGKLVLLHEVPVPASLVGPPSSIAISPDRKLALVSAATKLDPADSKKVVPFDLVSVVALDNTGNAAPRVIGNVHTGAGASGISINRAGTLALVANRVEGSVSVLAIDGEKVDVINKISLGASSGASHVAITPDGRRALVSRDGDHRITVLDINGREVTASKREIYAGLRPYSLDIAPNGEFAIVGNVGIGQGDSDTISLIDLKANPPRVIDTTTVGQTPEGVMISPDGRYIGVTVVNGSNKPAESPFHGLANFVLYRVEGGKLQRVSELGGGNWLQGQAYSPDGGIVLVQDAMNREIRLYQISSGRLEDTGQRLKLNGAPSAMKYWK